MPAYCTASPLSLSTENACVKRGVHMITSWRIPLLSHGRIGPKYRNVCANVVASWINWMTSSRYLGGYLESSIKFKCSFGKKTKPDFIRILITFLGKSDTTHPKRFCSRK